MKARIFSIYTHWEGISDPLIVRSRRSHASLDIRGFFFLLRYNVAEYCMVICKTRLQRYTDSQGPGTLRKTRARTLSNWSSESHGVDPRRGFCHFRGYQTNESLAVSYDVQCIMRTTRASPLLPHPLTVNLFVRASEAASNDCALEGGRQTTPDLGSLMPLMVDKFPWTQASTVPVFEFGPSQG